MQDYLHSMQLTTFQNGCLNVHVQLDNIVSKSSRDPFQKTLGNNQNKKKKRKRKKKGWHPREKLPVGNYPYRLNLTFTCVHFFMKGYIQTERNSVLEPRGSKNASHRQTSFHTHGRGSKGSRHLMVAPPAAIRGPCHTWCSEKCSINCY